MLNKKNLFICLGLITSGHIYADAIDDAYQINNIEVTSSSNIWDRIRSGFKLDHTQNRLVKYYEEKYTKNPTYFRNILNNATPYIYFILLETERRGLPSELALLPIVESSYKANAVSPGGISTGLWQFVSSSANRYNMQINSEIDERQDIIKSSQAAISYLTYLKDLFGSWELAIAAYNWGEGNIYNAMKKAGSTDYYNLETRDATQNYVPKLIALANIIADPGKFGITLNDIPNTPYFALVPSQNIQISDLNNALGISSYTFKQLNPQYKRNYLKETDDLLIPVDKIDEYEKLYVENTGKDFVPAVEPPDTSNFPKVTPKTSLANKINTMKPREQTKKEENELTTPHKFTPIKVSHYKVVKGDTIYSIAKKNHTTVERIVKDNHIKNHAISINQELIITHNK